MNPDRWLWTFSCEPHGVRILTQAFQAAGSKLFRRIWLLDGRAEAHLLQRRCRAGLCATVLRCPGGYASTRACAAGANCRGNVLGGRLAMGNGQKPGLWRGSELPVDQSNPMVAKGLRPKCPVAAMPCDKPR